MLSSIHAPFNHQAPQGACSARQGTQKRVCARRQRAAWGVETRLRMESDGRPRPSHRRRPKPPLPQGFGALAALERDDRAAVSERVPHRLPASEVTERGVTRKPAGVDFTHCAPTTRRCSRSAPVTASQREPLHLLPQRRRRRCKHVCARRHPSSLVTPVPTWTDGVTVAAGRHRRQAKHRLRPCK